MSKSTLGRGSLKKLGLTVWSFQQELTLLLAWGYSSNEILGVLVQWNNLFQNSKVGKVFWRASSNKRVGLYFNWFRLDNSINNNSTSLLSSWFLRLRLIMLWTLWSQSSTFDLSLKLQTVTWMNSVGACRDLRNLLRVGEPRHWYPHDADVLAHIWWLWTQLSSVSHNLQWVKGHQDNNKEYEDLPLNAQLNIQADELASLYAEPMRRVANLPKTNPEAFVTCHVSWDVSGEWARTRDSILKRVNSVSRQWDEVETTSPKQIQMVR